MTYNEDCKTCRALPIKGFRAWAAYNQKKRQWWRHADGSVIVSNRRILREERGDNNINVRVEVRVVRIQGSEG